MICRRLLAVREFELDDPRPSPIHQVLAQTFGNLDFEELSEEPIGLVKADNSNKGYGTYLGFLSGELLFNMYDKHGLRLLQKNVRAFLQARSNVNKGIRDTILHNPQRFLAYNNGLTIVATNVVLEELGNNIRLCFKYRYNRSI